MRTFVASSDTGGGAGSGAKTRAVEVEPDKRLHKLVELDSKLLLSLDSKVRDLQASNDVVYLLPKSTCARILERCKREGVEYNKRAQSQAGEKC